MYKRKYTKILLVATILILLLLASCCPNPTGYEHSGKVTALNYVPRPFWGILYTEVFFEDGYMLELNGHWELKVGESYYIKTEVDLNHIHGKVTHISTI